MQKEIAVLPQEVADQIAAGEVVERPASILKELIENAVDAGATDLSIVLEKGGCQSIRVDDNGEGIGGRELAVAFQRHATSKIRLIDDIYQISSFGFRGEALPSIASIARVDLSSRRKGELSGNRIVVEAGRVDSVVETGCPEGTSVRVTRIFENVPARRKFLKTAATEQAACMDVLIRLALSHPEIRLKVTANGRESLRVPQTTDSRTRLAVILGEDAAENMIDIQGHKDNITLSGYITRPEFSRSNTKGYFFFVNRRYVRDGFLSHAVMTAYRRVIPEKRHPMVVFFFDVPCENVDINVHPAKTEVRFKNPREMYELVVETLVRSLAVMQGVTQIDVGGGIRMENRAYQERVEEALKRYTLLTGSGKPVFGKPFDGKAGTQEAMPVRQYEIEALRSFQPVFDHRKTDVIRYADLTYLGQVGVTYLIFAAPDKLVVMDQHAAHERVIFERIRTAALSRKDFRQSLLVPAVLQLSPEEYGRALAVKDILAEAGLEVEDFGGNTIVLKAVPAALADVSPQTLLPDLLEEACMNRSLGSSLALKEKMFAVMACKGAVKAGHGLTPEEVRALCEEMDRIPFNATCPHGRPVCAIYTLPELDRLFKRT